MFEDFVCNYLSRNNINFRRQEEIGSEQIKQLGNAVATPDILLDEPIFINEAKIYWIDAKNCYGADCVLSRDRIAKQVNYGLSILLWCVPYLSCRTCLCRRGNMYNSGVQARVSSRKILAVPSRSQARYCSVLLWHVLSQSPCRHSA